MCLHRFYERAGFFHYIEDFLSLYGPAAGGRTLLGAFFVLFDLFHLDNFHRLKRPVYKLLYFAGQLFF